MVNEQSGESQYDESRGVEHLPQSELEASPGSGNVPAHNTSAAEGATTASANSADEPNAKDFQSQPDVER